MKTPQEIADIRAELMPYRLNPATIQKIAEFDEMTLDLCRKVCRDFDRKRTNSTEWVGREVIVDDLRESIEWTRRESIRQAEVAAELAKAMQPAPGKYAASFAKKVALLESKGIRAEVAAELANHTVETHTSHMLAEAIDQCGNPTPGIIVSHLRAMQPPKPTKSWAEQTREMLDAYRTTPSAAELAERSAAKIAAFAPASEASKQAQVAGSLTA